MQVSGVAQRSQEVVIGRGGTVPFAIDLNQPAQRFTRVYTNEVFALMGALAVSYRTGAMDQVKLRFQSYDHARIADGVLKDTVLGAKLVFADADGTPFDMTRPASPWTEYPTNYARTVASMPGVLKYRWLGTTILFETDTIDTRVKLQQLVERKLDGRVTAYWKGECFGPGCKPDPKPPTGEV